MKWLKRIFKAMESSENKKLELMVKHYNETHTATQLRIYTA